MSFRYTDVAIPGRSLRSGRHSRSSSDTYSNSRWELISQEELYGDRRRDTGLTGEEAGPFEELLRMTEEYRVTEEGRREAFLAQAKRMESYEEEGEVRASFHYYAYVGYQEMDVRELHGYFRWRTQFRRDREVPPSEAYIFLHAAELINLIGVKDEQEAFARLLRLAQEEYFCQTGNRHLPPVVSWGRFQEILSGFVVAWGPCEEIVQAYCFQNPERETENIILGSYEKFDDASVFRTIRTLAGGRTLKSDFVTNAGEDVWRVIARVFRRVCRMQKKADTPVLAERLLGRRRTFPRDLFPGIPYETRVEDGYCIEASPATSYSYSNGRWRQSAYPAMRDEEAVRDLSALLRECERVLRRKMHYRSQLADRMKNPSLVRMIEEEYDQWMREKAQRSRPEIHVDLSKLGVIRDLAAITRERLLEGTGEELGAEIFEPEEFGGMNAYARQDHQTTAAENEPPVSAAENASPVSAAENVPPVSALEDGPSISASGDRPQISVDEKPGAVPVIGVTDTLSTDKNALSETGGFFDAQESAFLRILLDKDSKAGADFFRSHKILPSAFVDAINEKAYDEIGDSIVEEEGGWHLVEDYVEDVRELLGES